jgi:Lrp/AsnC family leucine-responsive transcriptional regulator
MKFVFFLICLYIICMIEVIDRKIIGLLQGNARLSNAEIAQKVGLTASSVHERVKKLEKKGIITGYVATVDPEKLGKPLLAFIRLTVQPGPVGSPEARKSGVTALLADEPDILECHHVAGEDCYVLKVRAVGPKQLEQLMARIQRSTRSVRSVTNIVLSTRKESPRVEPAQDVDD